MSPPMSPIMKSPTTPADEIVRRVATNRGLDAEISRLFADEGSRAATVAAAWNALLDAGTTHVGAGHKGVIDVNVEVDGNNQVVVIADQRRIVVPVDDELLRSTLAQAFDRLYREAGLPDPQPPMTA